MKIYIGVLLAILASAGVIYHLSQGDGYTGSPFFYTCQTARSPPGLTYGWPVNGSLMLVDYYSIFRITDSGSGSQYICSQLWANMPKHNLTIIDPNLMVAYATDGVEFTHFLLINGTKWPFLGGGNQTASMGIPFSKVIQTNMAFLNNYPTTYYLPMPY